jgi:hypothetical protein
MTLETEAGAQPPSARSILPWFFLLVLVFGAVAMGRAGQFYGQLLHGWDAQFYYAQARSLVIDGDLDITNDLALAPDQGPLGEPSGDLRRLPRREGGQVVNKYPPGLSLLEVPWLALGRLLRTGWERATGGPLDGQPGYSDLEITTVGFGLLLYASIGLTLLVALVTPVSGSEWRAAVAVALTWLGTSLLYYTAVFPFMAHGAGFALVVLTLWLSKRLAEAERPTVRAFVAVAASVGFLFLVRPQQVLLLLFLGPWLIRPAQRIPVRRLLLPLLVFLALASLLVVFNYLQTDRWTVSGYAAGGEGFDWLHPRADLVLWSPERGLLWMSPLVVLAALGYATRRVWRSPLAGVLLLHALTQVYLIAAWSSPAQGDSFGARMWCECVPFVALGVAGLLSTPRPGLRLLWAGGAVVCVGWTCLLLLVYLKDPAFQVNSYGDVLSRVAGFWSR